MSFQQNIPPSLAAKLAKTELQTAEAEEETTGKRREDWRKLKELEEARKAGTAPAMQDEEGKDINPHIPQYIMQAPWYFGAMQPTLKHQREPDEWKKEYSQMNAWYKKGVKEEVVATKYRKGACENCGALTHKKKDCLERPRKIGAKFTGSDIAPDEHLQPDLDFSYDGKRDRWNGYDAVDHKKIMEEFEKMEEMKRLMKAQKMDKSLIDGELDESVVKEAGDEEDDDDKYADDMAMPGQKFETKQRITVRNLRIREDTAKYLYNLNPDSAFYDPKTRAMRENPFKESGVDPRELPYAGDNFVRWSGDAYEIAQKQVFAWEAYEKGTEVHVQADPTKLEALDREYQKKKETYKEGLKSNILDRYGGQEHLDGPPKQLLLAQTEEYVEYSRHGTLLKGSEKASVKSRYEEDILEKNHSTVWGSFWKDGKWGYKCCHSIIRGSYCIGKAGIEQEEELLAIENAERSEGEDVDDESSKIQQEDPSSSKTTEDPDLPKSLLHQHLEKLQAEEKKKKKKEKKKRQKGKKRRHHKKKKHNDSSDESSDELSNESSDDSFDDSEDDEAAKKLKKAMKKEADRLKEVERVMAVDERKRPYNVMYDGKGPSEEDVEAYKRLRTRDDDPMAKFMNR